VAGSWRLTIRSSGPLRCCRGNLIRTVAAATRLKRQPSEMSESIEASAISDAPEASATEHFISAPYFAVSPLKLAVMSICTLGIYELYWFYMNWRLIRDRERSAIMPFWRAFFGFFFCYQCFSHILNSARSAGIRTSVTAGSMAAAWILISLTWRLPDPYSVVTFLAFIPMIVIQSVASELNAKVAPGSDTNSRFSGLNIVGIVIGGLIFILAMIGAFMPPTEG
jgi:hypothetical protein